MKKSFLVISIGLFLVKCTLLQDLECPNKIAREFTKEELALIPTYPNGDTIAYVDLKTNKNYQLIYG